MEVQEERVGKKLLTLKNQSFLPPPLVHLIILDGIGSLIGPLHFS